MKSILLVYPLYKLFPFIDPEAHLRISIGTHYISIYGNKVTKKRNYGLGIFYIRYSEPWYKVLSAIFLCLEINIEFHRCFYKRIKTLNIERKKYIEKLGLLLQYGLSTRSYSFGFVISDGELQAMITPFYLEIITGLVPAVDASK